MSQNRKVMLINLTHAEESRVAIVAGGVLETFEIETFDHRSQKGNIYKGRVESVHPGLQAAFVDIGGARHGFLPLDELNFKVHPPRKDLPKGRLENHLHRGQDILVQVVRDAFATKPPTLSTYFSLPGRFLVLTPHAESAGISRKLDDKQRDRLRKVLDGLPIPEGFGVIVRTAGAAATKPEMQRDLKYLLRLWEKVVEGAAEVRPPKLIYQERSLVIRAIRDLYQPEIEELLVDDEATCEEILSFFDVVLPHKKKTVKLYQGDRPIFNKFNLEEQIENIFRRRVPLPSGGAVIFDTTEALTAVDVNSGRMKGEAHIEETALKANLEAAEEIARQLRLRDLGGLVVIDFIDMRHSKHARQVERVFKDGLRQDKAKYDVTRISSLGLLEVSRERVNPEKSSLRYTDCPTCQGTGSIKTIEAAAVQALRRLQTRVVRGDLENVEVILPPDIAEYLLNQKRAELTGYEERYRTRIIVKGDPGMIRDGCDIRTLARERSSVAEPVVGAPTHQEIFSSMDEEPETEPALPAPAAGAEAPAAEGGEGQPKKRRRRRGGRKHRRTSQNGKEGPAEAEEPARGEEPAPPQEEGPAVVAETATGGGGGEGSETAPSVREANGGNGGGKKRRRRRRRKKSPAAGPETGGGPDQAPPPLESKAPAAEAAPIAAVVAASAPEPHEGPPPRAWWWETLLYARE